MRQYLLIILFIATLLGCNSEDAPDCLKSTGTLITQEIELGDFSKLLINNEFHVVIRQGNEIAVSLTIGENIIDDITFTVHNELLEVSNTISCRWVRDYDFPLLEITHPSIEYIEIIGGSLVESSGSLNYPNLSLKSKSSNGTFQLLLQTENLSIDNNEITNYFIEGEVTNLNVVYSSGDSRFEGANLNVVNAIITHKSSNDIIVNVSNELRGSIGSTGDLIYVAEPPAFIDVTTDNRGRLIDGTN